VYGFRPDRFGSQTLHAAADGIPGCRFNHVGSGEDDSLRPRQSGQRLAQRASGKDVVEPKRLQSIEQNNIQIALQPAVLKTVVQQDHLGMVLLYGGGGTSYTIGILHVRHIRQPLPEFQGFIVASAVGALVTAADNAYAQAVLTQAAGNPLYQRRLASSAKCQVANADHRHACRIAWPPAGVVRLVTAAHDPGIRTFSNSQGTAR